MRKFTADQEIRAISIHQPYATLMLYGKIETRTWKTNYRGWVLFCATKIDYKLDKLEEISGTEGLIKILEVFEKEEHFTLQNGHAIGIGYLDNCRPMVLQDQDKCFVKYRPGLFCHVYSDVYSLRKHFPHKGKQGWGIVSNETKQQILNALEL